MKCQICKEPSVINLRPHHMSLCKEHFLSWVPKQVEKSIKKYKMFTHEEKVMVAVSGGKDSLALWDILNRLEYNVVGFYIDLGIDNGFNYSRKSKELTLKFAKKHSLALEIISLDERYDVNIIEMAKIAKKTNKVCSACGLVKRYLMNEITIKNDIPVFATGHNLDDEVSFLFGNTLNWQTSYLARQAPVLESHGNFARKVKPLCRIYEREMAAYALLRDIEYIHDECPFSNGSRTIYYKKILTEMESDSPGTKMHFYTKFMNAKKEGIFDMIDQSELERLHPCPSCGQPTSSKQCSFCVLIDKVRVEQNKN